MTIKRAKIPSLILIIIIAFGTVGAILPAAQAWDLLVSPASRSTVPGGTVTFSIQVTGPATPFTIQLLVSPPTLGITVTFSHNNLHAPYSSVMYVHVSPTQSPGTYPIYLWGHPSGTPFPGPGNIARTVYVVVGAPMPMTDWELFNPYITPASPREGDKVYFGVWMRALTSTAPFPQTVRLHLYFAGTTVSMSLPYPGPAGMSYRIQYPTPWTAKEGSYVVSWMIDPPPYQYNDPNRANNVASLPFSVGAAPPPFNFAIKATPESRSVKAGKSATFTVSVILASGTAQPISLSLEGLPEDTSHSFSPASGTPTFTSTLTVSTEASAPPGTYQLTIRGEGGGVAQYATISLTIEKAKAASSLSLSVSPTSLKLGESVSVVGTLSPAIAATVELVYRRPDGFELLKQVATSASGAFSDSLRPDMVGAWSVRARWAGDADREGCESAPASFSVEAPPPKPWWEAIPGGLTGLMALILIALAIVIAALAMRGRGPRGGAQPAPAPAPPATPTAVANRCPNCGAEYPEGSAFCPKCGEKIQ
ncbi:MAG: zinc ribbon domain-containing protein [Candidatus Bathyarchaeia archaeon]